ncbi:MAG: KH domain-containing protein, partial [Methanogenium sp.]|nr:KH domain-containing protein [Methanogenium sp.]
MQQIICFKERRYIEELRILTKSTAIDCIIDDNFDRVIYIIRKGDMGFAIGKRGDNIRKMQRVLGK